MVNIWLMMVNNNMVGGFKFQPTPLKTDGLKVSWDDCIISQYDGKVMSSIHVPVTTKNQWGPYWRWLDMGPQI